MGQLPLEKILHPDFDNPLKKPIGEVVMNDPFGGVLAASLFDQIQWHDLTGDKPITADITGNAPALVITRHGRGLNYTSGMSSQGFMPAGFGTQNHTFIFLRSPDDTTSRASSAWGTDGGATNERFQSHMPFSDGTIYFDYGGASGNNRITWTGYTKVVGELEVWVFTAGSHGMEIWFNGDLKSSSGVAVSRSADTVDFIINGGASNGDEQTVYFPVLLHRVMPHAEIISMSMDGVYRHNLNPAEELTYSPQEATPPAGGSLLLMNRSIANYGGVRQ